MKENLLLLKDLSEQLRRKITNTWLQSVSENAYIDKLAAILKRCKNTYHTIIKVNPVCVTSSTSIDFDKKNNEKDPKFKVDDHVRISKYKNTFPNSCVWNRSEEDFIIKKR